MIHTYDVGETVTLEVTFVNASGQAVTPSVYALYIERPDETTIDTVAQGAITTGANHLLTYDDTAQGPGVTWYRFVGTLSGSTVVEQSYYRARIPKAVPDSVQQVVSPVSKLWRVTLQSPDQQVTEQMDVTAASEWSARTQAEDTVLARTEQQGRDAGVVDQVGMTLWLQDHLFTVESVEEV